MNILIIDDERLARELLKNFLREINTNIFIYEAENGFEGLKKIKELLPDLIFLDIKMPKLNGFEMLELVEENEKPNIIFTTAHDEFAIKAFEENAIDYLLKPFSQDRFNMAFEKAKNSKNNRKINTITFTEQIDRIVTKEKNEIIIIPTQNIVFLEAQDDYVEINTETKKHLKKQTLSYYENALDSKLFIRIHRKFILNITHILKLEKYGKDTYMVILKNGKTLKVSQNGYKELRAALGF